MATTRNADPPEVFVCVESLWASTWQGQDVFIERGTRLRGGPGSLPEKYGMFFVSESLDDREQADARAALFQAFESGREKMELERQRAEAQARAKREAAQTSTAIRLVRAIKRIPVAVGPREVVLEPGDELPAGDPIVQAHADAFTPVVPPVGDEAAEAS